MRSVFSSPLQRERLPVDGRTLHHGRPAGLYLRQRCAVTITDLRQRQHAREPAADRVRAQQVRPHHRAVRGTAPYNNGSGTADFLHTALMSGIAILDRNGNPLSDFTIESGSGMQYTAQGAQAVSVPAAAWMFGNSLTALGAFEASTKYQSTPRSQC